VLELLCPECNDLADWLPELLEIDAGPPPPLPPATLPLPFDAIGVPFSIARRALPALSPPVQSLSLEVEVEVEDEDEEAVIILSAEITGALLALACAPR